MASRGLTSVTTAVIMALAIAAVIALVVISTPLAKSIVDKNHWSGEMGVYEPPRPINSSVGLNKPTLDGYCLAYTVVVDGYNVTYVSCPSTAMNSTAT